MPLSVVASILGWSPATTARMAKRYGHIGQPAMRQAMAALERAARPRRRKKKTAKGSGKAAPGNGRRPESVPA